MLTEFDKYSTNIGLFIKMLEPITHEFNLNFLTPIIIY